MRHRKDDWSGKYFKIFFFLHIHTHTNSFCFFFLWFQRCGKWSLIWCKLSNAPIILVFNIIFFFFSVIVHFINEVKKNSRDLWKIIYVQTHAQWPHHFGTFKTFIYCWICCLFFFLLFLKILFLFYLLDGNDWNMFFFYFKIKQIYRKRWYYFLK